MSENTKLLIILGIVVLVITVSVAFLKVWAEIFNFHLSNKDIKRDFFYTKKQIIVIASLFLVHIITFLVIYFLD